MVIKLTQVKGVTFGVVNVAGPAVKSLRMGLGYPI
jgi:hypothetical protein